MVEPTAFSSIAPCPDENWKAYVTAFRDYLAQCREALAASRQVYEDATGHIDTGTTKERTRTTATGRGLGLAKDAANHRSEFVYLLSAGASPTVAYDVPASIGYRPPLWASMNEVEPSASRKRRKAA